jgi:hypothetical protein
MKKNKKAAKPSELSYIKCVSSEIVHIEDLKPNPRNPNFHPKEQIKRLADVLKYQGIRQPIQVSRLSNFMVTGHGTREACLMNGWDYVPVNYQDFENEDQEYSHMVADNALKVWSELKFDEINLEIENLGPDFNIEMLGINNFFIEPADKDSDTLSNNKSYTSMADRIEGFVTGDIRKVSFILSEKEYSKYLKIIEFAGGSSDLLNFLMEFYENNICK